MTLDQLRYFAAAASYQHVGRAASSVCISPSVISSAIATLEDELGSELFTRVGRRIEITKEGRALLLRSQEILSMVDGLKGTVKGEANTLTGHFRFGGSHFLSTRMLVNAWIVLTEKHPQLTADISSMATANAISDVLDGKLDLAICFSPLEHPKLQEFPITEGEIVPVVRKGHPILKKSAKLKLEFLKQAKAIFHKSSQGVQSCESHPIFDKLGFQPNIDTFFDNDDIAIQALLNSDRWSFLPDLIFSHHKKDLAALSLPQSVGTAEYRISALRFKGRSQDPVLDALVKILSQACQ